jgi:hypothetical protein
MCSPTVSVNSDPIKSALIRRYLTVIILAMWMGGFTFYALIVIPTATKVLASVRMAGFITEQVTNWLNLMGIAAISFFLWNVVAEWNRQTRFRRYGLIATWAVMALTQIALFATHPFIDHLLNPRSHTLHDYDRFLFLHTVYLSFATAQWTAALLYLWLLFACWRHTDGQNARLRQ